MRTPALIAILSLLFLLLSTAEAQKKKCKCRGKRGPRGIPGPKGAKGDAGPPGPAGSGANCKLLHESGPSNVLERDTGTLSFSIPQLSVGSTCPDGFKAMSCDCHINSFKNGGAQVRTKIIGWGVFERFCLCNFEYLPGFAETVEVSAQVNCIKLECS